MPAFEAKNLCKFFRAKSPDEVRALDDVSLAIAGGSFAAITGPSGSGKSTLLALLGALDRPTAGQVLLDDKDLTGCSDVELVRARRRMGFVFQSFWLIPHLPIWENITYPLVPRGISAAERYQRAQTLLARMGLEKKIRARPEELSGGELQRASVARALVGQPEVLFADEPTSNLDERSTSDLIGFFQEVHAQGKTVIVSSHDPRIISLATNVYELEAGRLSRMTSMARS